MIEKLYKVFENPICDECLGRQFSQLLSGTTNEQRGKTLRTFFAMLIDAKGETDNIDMSNFYGFNFHNEKLNNVKIDKPGTCKICNGFFNNIDFWIKKIVRKMKKYEFKTFLIGTTLSSDLLNREENLWENIGVDFCEPIKSNINRVIGKEIEKRMKKSADPKNPDINAIIDIPKKDVRIQINPLFIYGEYRKLVRGIPQTKWPSGKYRTSVEQIIAKPLMKLTKGEEHKFHGLGREDIDARCLAWRPFVLEITEPKKRFFNLKKIEKMINENKKVVVRKLTESNISKVREIKEMKSDKEYRITVIPDRDISRDELKKIKSIIGTVRQKTPTRVLHRRSDKIRKRDVKDAKVKYINKRMFQLTVRCEAGLYIKELITGDNGRTKPSVSEILGCNCKFKDLDVLNIY
ncbi:MAG: tRNA pseudouridine(54/55) synthase Pus10 [Candidatus Aenigmarchaeota archaeon]|nr:tRNA pseudouridine(54/55) synthase Pus10 [Candidatus Aenigmarchaeota archaeon]